jgi:hypothetical protein
VIRAVGGGGFDLTAVGCGHGGGGDMCGCVCVGRSFAVLLAELLGGGTPYADKFLTPVQVACAVMDKGLRPSLPPCHAQLAAAIRAAWRADVRTFTARSASASSLTARRAVSCGSGWRPSARPRHCWRRLLASGWSGCESVWGLGSTGA